MFRLYFDHSTGYFTIQILRMGLIWRTVCHKTTQGVEPLRFTTYEDARSWVKSIGLDELYDELMKGAPL